MKTCPHCGQAVHSEGPRCPLCRHDMRGASGLPETSQAALNSGAMHAPLNGSTDPAPGRPETHFPVGLLPDGATPCGALDMLGTVPQWLAPSEPEAGLYPSKELWRLVFTGSHTPEMVLDRAPPPLYVGFTVEVTEEIPLHRPLVHSLPVPGLMSAFQAAAQLAQRSATGRLYDWTTECTEHVLWAGRHTRQVGFRCVLGGTADCAHLSHRHNAGSLNQAARPREVLPQAGR